MKKTLTKVTVVVPVYGDWPSLNICIESLKLHTDPSQHTVILINDCGPEVELMEKNIKRSIKSYAHFKYYRNKKNLGFVGTCNRAVNEIDKTGNDILLLNSDTKVTEGAIREMQELMLEDGTIATVSPRTNNATICTIPIRSINQKGINKEASFALFKKYAKNFERYTAVPTSHGFCMLIRRGVINQYGLFDKVFGKGYGEEVDFCQRIQKGGWKCVISNWSYVFHLEARSFSFSTKKQLLEVNGAVIQERYPDYKKDVTRSIAQLTRTEDEIFSWFDKTLIELRMLPSRIRKKLQ